MGRASGRGWLGAFFGLTFAVLGRRWGVDPWGAGGTRCCSAWRQSPVKVAMDANGLRL